MNLKPQFDKIAVWITDCSDQKAMAQLKKDIIEITQIDEKEIEYEIFSEVRDKKPINKFKNNKFKKNQESEITREEKWARNELKSIEI